MPATQSNQSTATAQLNKPILRLGSKGTAVTELQKLLTARNAYYGAIDGIFNEEVEYAVIVFQNWVFRKEDGIVGQLTWQSLYTGAPVNMPVLKRGMQGKAVVTLQNALALTGNFQQEANGIFGPVTEAGVKSFQRRSGLLADGIVGEKTWYGLSKFKSTLVGC